MAGRRRPIAELEREALQTMTDLRASFAAHVAAANAHQAAAEALLAAIEDRARS